MASLFEPKSEDLSDLQKIRDGDEINEAIEKIDFPFHLSSDDGLSSSVEKSKILDFGSEGFLLSNILSTEECNYYIQQGKVIGYGGIKGATKLYRNASRIMFKNEDLASAIWNRVQPFLNVMEITEDPEKVHIHGIKSLLKGRWKPLELNNLFRLCHYEPGGHFAPHYDGHLVRSSSVRSMKTLMFYLNEGFENGTTNFVDDSQTLYMDKEGKYCAEKKNILYRIQPKTGLAIIFNHHRLHEGEAVRNGKKYILRTDIMYEKIDSADIDPKEEEALQIVQEAERLECSGDQMEAMRLYRKAFKMSPSLAESYGN